MGLLPVLDDYGMARRGGNRVCVEERSARRGLLWSGLVEKGGMAGSVPRRVWCFFIKIAPLLSFWKSYINPQYICCAFVRARKGLYTPATLPYPTLPYPPPPLSNHVLPSEHIHVMPSLQAPPPCQEKYPSCVHIFTACGHIPDPSAPPPEIMVHPQTNVPSSSQSLSYTYLLMQNGVLPYRQHRSL